MFQGSADSLSVRGLRLHFKEDIKKRVPLPPSPSCAHVPLTMTIYKYRLKQRGALLRCFATWLLHYMATSLHGYFAAGPSEVQTHGGGGLQFQNETPFGHL